MPTTRLRSARRARAAFVAGGALLCTLTGCGGTRPTASGGVGTPTAPAGEFLAVAGDSTYWVTSGPDGVRVRSAPLFLTRWDGRLADVYVVDDGVRFEGAEFTSARVYRRDLLRGDSTLVLADGEVPSLAAQFEAAYPDARPLDDADEAESEAALVAEHSVALVAVHGPYLTLDLRTAVDGPGDQRRDTARRRVVDLRTGRTATLASLFGEEAPRALAAAGRRAFAAALATLDTLHTSAGDDSAQTRARSALASLRFDAADFGLTAIAGAPAVQFVARGADRDGAVTLALPPVPVTTEPAWWTADVRPLLPAAAPGAARLLARLLGDTDGDTQGDAALQPVVLEQLVRLDPPPRDAALRRALRRAFDERAFDDAVTTSVAWRRYR